MINNPFLSILIPTWNRVDSVINAVESVDNHEVEIIVVDNHSDMEIYRQLEKGLKKYPNVKLFRNDENIGMVRNWNKCMSYASGEWMGLLCSDDNYIAGSIERVLEIMKKTDKPHLIIQDNKINQDIEEYGSGFETSKNINLPLASGNFWHRDIIENLGGFDERFEYSPDAEFWYRVATLFPVIKVKVPFANYHSHENNYMWHTWGKENFLEQMELISRTNLKHFGYSDMTEINEKIHEGIWRTILTILENTYKKKNRKKVYKKYYKIAKQKADSKQRQEDLLRILNKNKTNKFFRKLLKKFLSMMKSLIIKFFRKFGYQIIKIKKEDAIKSDISKCHLDQDRMKINNYCPICNDKSSLIIDNVKTINPNSDELLSLKECSFCKHWWIDPMPKQEYLIELYSQSSEFVVPKGYVGTELENDLNSNFDKKLQKYFGFNISEKTYNYLEVGVGSGNLFKYMKKKCNICYGVEPGVWKYKNENIINNISDIPKNIKFDIIVIQDVLEHLENPVEMLNFLKFLTNLKCTIVLGFPNKDSRLAKKMKSEWRMVRPVGHLHFFSKKSIKIMAKKTGWNIKKIINCRPGHATNFEIIIQSINKTKNPIKIMKNIYDDKKDQWYVKCESIR